MANKPFDREVVNVRERPLSRHVNEQASYAEGNLRWLMQQMYPYVNSVLPIAPYAAATGFFGNGFKVIPAVAGGLAIDIAAGLGFLNQPGATAQDIGGLNGVDDNLDLKPISLSTKVVSYGLAAAPGAGQERYDVVEVIATRTYGDPVNRDILNPATGIFAPGSVNRTLSWDAAAGMATVLTPLPSTTTIGVVTGVAAAVGAAAIPPATPGYTRLAVIYVGPAAAGLTLSEIVDRRVVIVQPGTLVGQLVSWGAATMTEVVKYMIPGVQDIATRRVSATSWRMYIILGDQAPYIGMPYINYFANGVAGQTENMSVVFADITLADQVGLAGGWGASLSNVMNVAVDQPSIQVQLTFSADPGAALDVYFGAHIYGV